MTPYLIEQLARMHSEDLQRAAAHERLVREFGCRSGSAGGSRFAGWHLPSWGRGGRAVAGCQA